ncbi:RPM1 interacting protein 13 [Quillaja saponaria]|uniref:RPM1 interacting protein 13 n=1 Tax=Quillaja saponaria TaxID=32244 RepID=A0AAD7Q0T8_QUISA|nr:RPM1 interacting protein 13 [Quillaja saponaria]
MFVTYMDKMAVVLDISSDEEFPLDELPKSFDYDYWIKEFIGMDDKELDDSDEVVVVGEVNPKEKSRSSKQTVKDVEDDCILLDRNPYNLVTSMNEKANGSDELQIVGEKGQIACRDYPHPRHLCAKFPFTSTPHERHCDQCHCYVCDSLAPCVRWGTGISSTDHCHATEKSDIWKIQRTNFKQGKTSPLIASKSFVTTAFLTPPLVNQVPPLVRLAPNSITQDRVSSPTKTSDSCLLNSIPQSQASGPRTIHACSSSLNSLSQNQDSQPNTMHACSTRTNLTGPGVIRHGTNQDSGFLSARSRHLPRQWLGVRNNVIQRDRANSVTSNLGSQFVPSHMMFKGAGTVGSALTINGSAVSSGDCNRTHVASQCSGYHTPRGVSNHRNPGRLDDVWPSTNLPSYTHPTSMHPNLDHAGESTVSSEPQGHSQPLSQVNDSQSFQQRIQGQYVHPSHADCQILDEYVNQFNIASQPVYQHGIQSENISGHGNHSQNAIKQTSHQGSQSQSAINADFSAYDFSWVESTSQINQPAAGSSHLGSTGSGTQLPPVMDSNTQFTGISNLSSLDFEFEDCLLENQSLPVVSDGLVPSELNILSPEPTPIDAARE